VSWVADPSSPSRAPAEGSDTLVLADAGTALPPRRRRGGDAALTLLLTAALCAVTAVADGGMRLGPMTSTEIGVLLVSGVVVAAALIAAPPQPRLYGALPVAAMLLLTGVAAWSITWAIDPSGAWIDTNRHLAYLAAFAAAVALAHLARDRGAAVLGAITLSALLISAYALMTKVLPGVLHEDEVYARLREPYGYWNAVGIAAALGVPGLLWLGARRTGHAALNALAAPGVVVCVATIFLAYSRGAVLACAIGVALWFATVPLRLRGVAVLLLGGLGGAAIAVWAFGQHGLSDDRVELAVRESAGYELGVAIAAVLLVVLLASLALSFAVAERPPSVATRRQAGAIVLVVLALAPIALAGELAVSDRGFGGSISHAWHSLTDTSATLPSNGPDRLTAVGSVRAQYWSEALKVFRDHLARGAGAGGYETARRQYRESEIAVRHAHGYVMQVAADLGLVGLAVSLALLAAWLAAAMRATGLRPRDRGPASTSDRIVLLTLLTVVVMFGVHSLIDFTWFVPGNALPALVAAGFLAGRGPLRAPGAYLQPSADRIRSGFRSPLRVAAAAGAIALALVAAWAVYGPQRSANAGQDALALLDRGNVDAARQKALQARDENPLSVDPLFELSVVEQKAGQKAAAREALERAVRLQPENPVPWLRLAEFELYVLDRPAVALDSIRPALYLDPRDTETIDTFVNARRAATAATEKAKAKKGKG
jgi:tetratricopeptide (TPR) repeat protein